MANSNIRRPIFEDAAEHYDDRRDARPTQESDPLAELARLIGQTDPLSSFGRSQPAQHEPQFDRARHEDDRHDDDRRDYDDRTHYDDRRAASDDAEEPAHQPPSWLQSAPAWRNEPAAPSDDRFYAGEQRAFVHDDRAAPDDRHAEAEPQAYAQEADPRYDDALYGRAPHHADHADHSAQEARDAGPPYAYPGHEQGYDEQYAAEEEAPARRRGGMLTVGIVAALAVLGTAGAFAYRSYSGGAKSGEPPVIRADATPTKVVPPAPSKDPSGKVITDRIGPSGERVVSREEAPVDVKGAQPRVVFPPLTQQPSPTPPAAQPAGLAGGGGMSDEPKRIKTVSVRPDQPAQQSAAPAPQARPAPATTPAAGGNAPIQLTPQRSAPDPRPVAAVPPAASAPAASGGYVVQVSSQKTEAEAASSYRALQSKFPAVLGSRQPLIKRADLSAQGKGVVYRAVVGPFASQEDASQMCGNLKVAGGQCVVQRN